MATKRHLAAIMFTDITGFSAMMQRDEMLAKRIRKRHREVFRGSHQRYQGKILQYYGDGTLSIFESAAAAVECAVEMQIAYRMEPEVPLRIGIHTGDISYDDEGAYGDGLNIASRIERLCVPGGVYISAKVYDDIKNHSWLSAVSLGLFRLRNIMQEKEIFAVTSKGLAIPASDELARNPEFQMDVSEQTREETAIVGGKKKTVTALLAFFFGVFGLHRFYLGQRFRGFLYLIAFFLGMMATISSDGEFPAVAIVGLIGFIDSILFFAMPKVEFDLRYNSGKYSRKVKRKKIKKQRRRTPPQKHVRLERAPVKQQNADLNRGISKYKEGDYMMAVEAFQRALRSEPSNMAIHFNLGCCYSILKDFEDAYYHISKAVALGFNDFDKINKHEALTQLREHAMWKSFLKNNYRVVEQLPAPEPDLLSQEDKFNPDILDKIESLGELMERGALTRDEFELRKKKILRGE